MDQEPDKKKGLFSRLTDALFVEIEAEEEHAASAGDARPAPAAAAEEARLGQEDEKLLQEILSQVRKEGPLLEQFLELAVSLREIVPQESAAYQAALKALEKTSAAGKSDLLAAADRQLAALAAEKAAFEQSARKKMTALQATGRKAEEVRARISELQKSIQSLEQEEKQLYTQMAAEEKLVRTAQLRFDTVTRQVERDIRGRLEKIRNYLPDAADAAKPG
jgi:hypothetical protein